jgi:hypothetical protein
MSVTVIILIITAGLMSAGYLYKSGFNTKLTIYKFLADLLLQ